MDYLSKQPECTLECEVDMWLVRGVEIFCDHPSSKVTEFWRKALELRKIHNLGYPGKPAIDLYEGVQEVGTLTDFYNISQKNYLIQCVLISERVFGPLYYTSCDLKIRLTNHLYSEGSVYYWRCCELLYQLLQAVVKTSWMPTQASIDEFEMLLHQVNTLLPAFNTDVMTMERNPVMLEALQLLFHPLTRDEPIFHSIMKSKYFLKYENVLNAFIALSTPDMLEISDEDGLTALHLACMLETVPDSVIHALIQAGSHLDSVTPSNRTPMESCINELSPQYLALRSYYPLRLACLSVRIIVEYQLSAETLPAFFHTFIDFHRTAPSKVDFCLTQNIRLVLKYFLILLLSITCLQASAECDFPDDSMKEGFSIGLVLGGSPTMVDSYHSCSVRDQNDTSKYTYIFLTLVIEDDANYYARLSLICNVGIWIVDNTTGTISVPNNPPVFLNSSYLRVDCYECNLNFSPFSSDMYGCMECHDDCLRAGVNTSLGYCYRQSASECCSYSLDGISGPDCSNCDLIGQNGTTWTDCSACICAVDYLGTVCESQYLPCLGTPCQDGGLCIDGIGDNVYTYDCNNMWEGTDCTTCPIVWNWCGDECDTCGFTSCLNGGSPNSTCDGCNCVERWTGIDCSTCEFSSCLNAGTANSTCHGCTCITSWGGFDCSVCGITCGNEGFHNTICTGCDCVESIGRILVVLPVGWTANIVLVHIQIALGVNVLVH
ncbi:hypothetical protein LOD99_1952 [Oopsacas minuta]|uniref:EGF-like domain-containing protein n=1 Tax=Oopsacas minuta TaxID=111878 RepID=A0AAV7K600_9METZ|nr:hypothetical protein LOD99_1952 [Oopsacas minuta]